VPAYTNIYIMIEQKGRPKVSPKNHQRTPAKTEP